MNWKSNIIITGIFLTVGSRLVGTSVGNSVVGCMVGNCDLGDIRYEYKYEIV